jgi:hypothetical protein
MGSRPNITTRDPPPYKLLDHFYNVWGGVAYYLTDASKIPLSLTTT